MSTRIEPLIILIIFVACVPPGPLQAQTTPGVPRLRLLDPQIRGLVQAGGEHSPSFRALLDRLATADVVVYVQCARVRSHLDGELLFMGAGGGFRYVMVRLAWQLPPMRKVAILGHELQHAIEIADRPEIVDSKTLARAYQVFGFTRHSASSRLDFDTTAAIGTGRAVWRELGGRADGD